MAAMPTEASKVASETPLTPPPTPETSQATLPTPGAPTPKRARKSPPKKLVPMDDPEMPPLREVIPASKALVSPPIIQTSTKRGKIFVE